MNAIDAVFQRLRAAGRRAFIPFLTAGDPDVRSTVALARVLADAGADLLELGFPYSDPIADGPVIQASYTRALDRGIRLSDMFDCARRIAETFGERLPLVAMTSYSLVWRREPAAFLDRAAEAGFAGLVVPDLPFDEASALADLAAQRDLKLIQLVTPTTPRERAGRIAAASTGFLYCVSVAGITGARDALPVAVIDQLAYLRGRTDLPLCVGFGISKPEHTRLLRPHADGIIVGSAIVRHLEGDASLEQRAAGIGALARGLREALDSAGSQEG